MSNIRFFKASSGYTAHINSFYAQHPEFRELNYESGLDAFFDDCFSWADFWKKNLEKTGKFHVCEVVFNNEVLQKKWALENNFKFSHDNWQHEILIEQLCNFKPDVLFITDIYNYAGWYKDIKKIIPSLKLVLAWDGILWHKPGTFSECDIVLSCVEDSVEFYRLNGKRSFFFPFGFEKSILNKLTKNPVPYEVSFVGSIVLIPGYHYGRLRSISHLSAKVPMNIWASNFVQPGMPLIKGQVKRLLNLKFREFADVMRIALKNRGELFGKAMYNTLYNSKFTFNTHGDNSLTKAANFRLTEATGVGSCLVTDWKENISNYFDPENEIVTYRTIDEAAEKINYLLENENKRKAIAEAGQLRTLNEYSFEKRINDFVTYLNTQL